MKKIVLILLVTCISHDLTGWGQNGHRIVAQICYDNLSEKARIEVDKILDNNYLAGVATWPDFIRSDSTWNFIKPWHFITVDSVQTVEQVMLKAKNNPKINNVIEAIDLMKEILKGNSTAIETFENLMKTHRVTPLSNSVKLTALALLIHFTGDIHQPMHVGLPSDVGGNSIDVLFFSDSSNLHTVWDEGIIDQQQLGYTEFARFINKLTAPQKSNWEKASIEDWATESVQVRNKIYKYLKYNRDKETNLPLPMSYSYLFEFLPDVQNRLGAAGFRAAQILNSIFP